MQPYRLVGYNNLNKILYSLNNLNQQSEQLSVYDEVTYYSLDLYQEGDNPTQWMIDVNFLASDNLNILQNN